MSSNGLVEKSMGAICALGLGLGVSVYGVDGQPPDSTQHHEIPGDAPAAKPAPPQVKVKRIQLAPRNTMYAPVQVNVDAMGDNIPGDAGNEPSIVVDPTAPNRLAIGWRQFDTITSNFRQAGWAYSKDGGRTWTFPGVIEPGIFRSDPVLDADSDGNFYYHSLTSDMSGMYCHVFKSTDGGVTWGEQVYAFGGDKQWMAIDRTGGIGDGNIYAAWNVAFSICDGQFNESFDRGETFEDCFHLFGQPYWGTVNVGPDGEVYVSGESLTSGMTLVLRSDTLQDPSEPPGFNFWSPINFGAHLRNGDGPNPGGLLGQIWVATDHSDGPTRGNVYALASVGNFGSDPLDVRFIRSTNQGVTWSDPVRVNDDGPKVNAWQWFGTMSVAPNGRIDAIWNDTRNDPDGELDSELFYSCSHDAGVTWSENVALTPAFDPHIGWPQQNKIGDYIEMVSDKVGAHVTFVATFNGEQDVYYLRIGDYDCNDNGIGDSEDLATGFSFDCNGNDMPDECEIAATPELDADGSGILDECEDIGDLDGDGQVGAVDLLALLGGWGPCPEAPCPWDFTGEGTVDDEDAQALMDQAGDCPDPPVDCPWDLTGDSIVDVDDLWIVLDHYGPCP